MFLRAYSGRVYTANAAMVEENLERAWLALVGALVAAGTLRSPQILAAFRAVPRSRFVPPEHAAAAATVDAPLSIGQGQTVSQPTTVATMLELVQPRPGEKALDVGTGSGWQAALLAHGVRPGGTVITVERIPELSRRAGARLRSFRNVTLLVGDATAGVPVHAPYDVIISAASSPEVPPSWIEQLAVHGRLLHPIAGMGLRVLRKDSVGRISTDDYPGFVFVPLVSDGQPVTLGP
ncbi:MAG: protein-L-isoaspartate(D-aspartate) O-methyltransferase [Parcubacteria group bacterium Gr01-1014_38]|nr:MAG: protein-L-isoaspartate(D-aspartate) O-methyltransferase [Parcubacteria group bacterium Gr01-1014_38]